LANVVCCECKIIIRKGIETKGGLDSHSLCPKCETKAYEQLLSDLEASGATTEQIERIKEKIKEINFDI